METNVNYINHNDIVYINCDALKIIKQCDSSKPKTIITSNKDFIFFNEDVKPTYTEKELIDMNLYDIIIVN